MAARSATAAAAVSLMRSPTAIAPSTLSRSPRSATHTTVRPFSSSARAAASSADVSAPSSRIRRGLPMRSLRPSTVAAMPRPTSARKSETGASAIPRSPASASTALAMGCSLPACAEAVRRSSSSSPARAAAATTPPSNPLRLARRPPRQPRRARRFIRGGQDRRNRRLALGQRAGLVETTVATDLPAPRPPRP